MCCVSASSAVYSSLLVVCVAGLCQYTFQIVDSDLLVVCIVSVHRASCVLRCILACLKGLCQCTVQNRKSGWQLV